MILGATKCEDAVSSQPPPFRKGRGSFRWQQAKTAMSEKATAKSGFLMPDPAEQLQRIYLAGFELHVFDRYPNSVGVERDGCIALLRSTPAGLQLIGSPGWRMGEVLGVLVEQEGKQVFQAKSEIVDATPEKLDALRKFKTDLEQLMIPAA